GLANVITFDMGGTTAKASLIEAGRPSITSEFEVGAGIALASRLVTGGGYALTLPMIDLSEVGAGGGSVVWPRPRRAPRGGARPARPRLLRPGRRGADGDRRQPHPRLPQPAPPPRRRHAPRRRRSAPRLRRGDRRAARPRAARRRLRRPQPRQHQHDPRRQGG